MEKAHPLTSSGDGLGTYLFKVYYYKVNINLNYNQLNSLYNYFSCLEQVKAIQSRIAAAVKLGNMEAVKKCQFELVASKAAQVVAAIKIFRSNGAKTPGSDGFTIITLSHFQQVLTFLSNVGTSPWKYKAQPVKRIYIPEARHKCRETGD